MTVADGVRGSLQTLAPLCSISSDSVVAASPSPSLSLQEQNPVFSDVQIQKPINHKGAWIRFEAGRISYNELVEMFQTWRDHPVMVALWKEASPCLEFMRGRKRGDKAYIKHIRGKNYARTMRFVRAHDNLNYYKFITLTITIPSIYSVYIAQKQYNRFITALRYHYQGLKVFRANELQLQRLQERGEIAVHIHLLLYGAAYIPKSRINKFWKIGRITDIQRPRSVRGIAAYLQGYLTKTFADPMNTAYFWATHSKQWSSNYPNLTCQSQSISKSFVGAGVGDPRKVYGLGAVWWWWGGKVRLKELSRAGWRGWEVAFKEENWADVAVLLRNTIQELKAGVRSG